MTALDQDLIDAQEEQTNVIDDAGEDDSTSAVTYNISSYGADYDVDGIVKRLNRGDILIPAFQRDYVWSLSDASRFIESLLLGLPVPGVFLAKESDTNRSLVIDGQQRLKTLQYYYSGYFNPKESQKSQRVFKLYNVQKQFEGKTYDSLDPADKVRLNDTIIHATVIKQESPAGDDTSVYHVFERLNTGGRKLTPQEIRTAIFHGNLINLLRRLNSVPSWRKIFGKESKRLKDQELILRFLALYFDSEKYSKPMNEFLNKFIKSHRNVDEHFAEQCINLFTKTINAIHSSLGTSAFRPERSLNAAVFDAVMVAVARRLNKNHPVDSDKLYDAYETLLKNENFNNAYTTSTSDTGNVKTRIEIASDTFKSI